MAPRKSAKTKTMLAFGDVHIPHHNAKAVEVFCRVAEHIRPDLIVCLGDLLDCGQFSSHPPTHGVPESEYHDDLKTANALLDRLQTCCDKLVMVEGNHEYRLDRWAAATSEGRGAYSMLAPRLQLSKGRANFTYIPYGSATARYPHYAINSRIIAVHGWSFARHATKNHLQISQGKSVIHGHTHRADSSIIQNIWSPGQIVQARSGGCLCKPIPLYGTGKPVEWVNGFILGYLGRRSDTLYTIPILGLFAMAMPRQTVERIKEETEGGILHWGRETENAETLEWFRQEIRKAYGGRAPKVLDPFAGGGAIPLEAMRLGCEATAVDINPVAWFILKCTLEYPQKLAGQTRPLPEFILHNDDFMAEFFKKAKGYSKAEVTAAIRRLHKQFQAKRSSKGQQDAFAFTDGQDELQADLAWHVRAWGQWVLNRARRELAKYYPTYADFEPIKKGHVAYEPQPMRLVPLKEDGTPDIDSLNAEFTEEYLADKRNPRWVAKPTVAYLWARTVTCKNCRATVPLLKTRWLCKKTNKRVLLTMNVVDADAASAQYDGADGAPTALEDALADRLRQPPSGKPRRVVFGIHTNVPVKGGNAAQRREQDKRLGTGTMSRAGATCPCCGTINTMQDLRLEGQAGRLGSVMTAVVIDGPGGKEYRLPTEHELAVATLDEEQVQEAFKDVPFGVPEEPTPSADALGMRVPLYGFDKWRKLFTPRQLTSLGRFVAATRAAREEMTRQDMPPEWVEAVGAYLASSLDRLADYSSTLCLWTSGEFICHTFARFALPITWDFVEVNPLSETTGNLNGALNWVTRVLDHLLVAGDITAVPTVTRRSAIQDFGDARFDAVVTDPPYYDAIPYSDLMDFFYLWIRRGLVGQNDSIDSTLATPLAPKWDRDAQDGELIDDCSRHGNDASLSKKVYEDGMAAVFSRCAAALTDEGKLVVVFANKQPDAWETLVAAIIRAGFVVDGSWPIQTEREARMRAYESAALASSVWLVCKKRSAIARPGWDNKVLEEMRANIAERLREYWDAGIRGPDFVWAATGPALEAYSKHPVVRKANAPGETMKVGEFLNHVRRMVVDYVVGQVLTGEQGSDTAAADRLDEVTAYYLLHRHDFGMEEAPVGACILYATACGLSDTELDRTWDILAGSGKASATSASDDEESDEEGADDGDGSGGSKVKLKPWNQRKGRSMGYEAPEGKPVPLIDRIHRVMHLWREGDVQKVDQYLDDYALRRNELFKRVVQSLIELSSNSERSLLESISNHIGAKGAVKTSDEAEAMRRAYREAGHA